MVQYDTIHSLTLHLLPHYTFKKLDHSSDLLLAVTNLCLTLNYLQLEKGECETNCRGREEVKRSSVGVTKEAKETHKPASILQT